MSKKEKELTDTDNSVVMGEGGEWVEVEKGIRGINGNVNTIKNKLLKKKNFYHVPQFICRVLKMQPAAGEYFLLLTPPLPCTYQQYT